VTVPSDRNELPITPDPNLAAIGSDGESQKEHAARLLAHRVDLALRWDIPIIVEQAHVERVGFLRRRTITVIDEARFEA
jgi:hypothetical protein